MVFLVCLLTLGAACAPEQEVFNARLSPLPIIGGAASGIGSATATLSGTTLEVAGSFEELSYRAGRGGTPAMSVATGAQLHSGPVTAVRGPAFADLTLEPTGDGSAGIISGSIELTDAQVDMLRKGQVYAQISSEEAPDGHLWGWFLQ